MVLSNARSEPRPAPQTPTKAPGPRRRSNSSGNRSGTATPNPVTPRTPSKAFDLAARKSRSTTADAGKDSFEWPSSDEDELFKAADRAAVTTMPAPETPRKAQKTDRSGSPGKRRHEAMENSAGAWPTPTTDDVFTTSATGMRGMDLFSTASAAGLLSPAETPTPHRFKDAAVGVGAEEPELVRDVVNTLHDAAVRMDSAAMAAVKAVLNKHVLKVQGIAKGRDISRLAIKAKDATIAELQARVAALEAERETNRAVIRHLRRDMEAGRKR